jgi:ATP/maltotriose-dependent transcriptional regulator MalT
VSGVYAPFSHASWLYPIYAKLAVNNRRAAVRRAEELALLSQIPTR